MITDEQLEKLQVKKLDQTNQNQLESPIRTTLRGKNKMKYYLEAVEAQYVTTDITYKDREIDEMNTRHKDMGGLENIPRFYRIKTESDDSQIVEIQNDFTMAEHIVILLNKGEITEEEAENYNSVNIEKKFEEVTA